MRTETDANVGVFRMVLLTGTVLLCIMAAGKAAHAVSSDADERRKTSPFHFVLDYGLWSDFICRKSINLSEYPGEGQEDFTHQVWAAVSMSSKDVMAVDIGTFSTGFWVDWFEGQSHITPEFEGDLNEWDIISSWTWGVPRTPVTFSLTYDYWVLPPYDENGASHDSYSGHEVWFTLAFDDSAVFGRPVFNPYVLWVRDMDDYDESWFDIGVSHTFSLAQAGCTDIPVLKNISITPKMVIGIDDGYVDAVMKQEPETRFASVNYSLTVTHNLGAALGMRPGDGDIGIRGFIHFKDQLDDYDTVGFYPVLRDEVYGGAGITYSW